MNIIGIIEKKSELSSLINQLIEKLHLNSQFQTIQINPKQNGVIKPNIFVITELDDKINQEKYINSLLKTKNTIIANLADEEIAEIIKIVMKQSSVTVIDYNKHKITGNNSPHSQIILQVGLTMGLAPEDIFN